uniref:Basic helix-loop-helix family member e41 n=1 Tax=Pseudonaja textilis TaxID=8673 RepID=A0A670XZ93_PSETE
RVGARTCPRVPACSSRAPGILLCASGETYKLPHRLIEKKRRDRINECIALLKDLLPEHLKLTTLGHLEKAVVLELTLKHVKTLTALTEQQHQRIIALQNGKERGGKSSLGKNIKERSDLEAFHSGFQTCAKEVLHYLARPESCSGREQRCVQVLGHLRAVCARFLPGCPLWIPKQSPPPLEPRPGGALKQEPPPQAHCVPVIQRTQNWGKRSAPQPPPSGPDQAGEPDTDTDSGYGGEGEGKKTPQAVLRVKREPAGDGVGGAPEGSKRRRLENAGSPSPGPGRGVGVSETRPALFNPRMALGVGGGIGGALLAHAAPTASFCLPFYFIAPSAAYLQPFLEKVGWEASLYPAGAAAGPFPLFYPGISIQGAAPAALPSLAAAEKGSPLSGAAPAPLAFPGRETPLLSPLPGFSPPPQAGRTKGRHGSSPKA